MSSRPKQSMSELKLRRLLEHNQRLREDLGRPRIRVSEASASLIRYCKTTTDHLVSPLSQSISQSNHFPSFFTLLYYSYLFPACLPHYLVYFFSLDEEEALVLTSFCRRSHRCGAPSAKTRIHMRRRATVDVVPCNEKDTIAAAADIANAPAAKRERSFFPSHFVLQTSYHQHYRFASSRRSYPSCLVAPPPETRVASTPAPAPTFIRRLLSTRVGIQPRYSLIQYMSTARIHHHHCMLHAADRHKTSSIF